MQFQALNDYMHEPGGMQCGRVNSGGRSRGIQQGAFHQGAIITIMNQIVGFTGHAALLRFVGSFNLDWVFGVVEINDMNVKDEHSRARNEVSYSGTKKLAGQCCKVFGLFLNACVKLTYSSSTIRHVRRDDNPSLLSYAKPLQGFIHPLDHISLADVRVIGAVSLVADKETQS